MTLEEMKEKKKQSGYSCEKISELSGVPLGTVQKIFSGITKAPRFSTLQELEKVFAEEAVKTEVNYLQGREPSCMVIREPQAAYHAEEQTPQKKQGEYTLEDYYALPEERWVELIDGVFYEMLAPSYIHQFIAAEVFGQLRDYIRKKKGKCMVVQGPADVQLDCDNRTMLEPDVLVICDRDKILRRCCYGAPDFVVEVLSPSTRKKDMGVKMQKYIEAEVREYWLVDPDKKKVVVYDLEHGELPVVYGSEDVVPVRIFDGECKIDFKEIFEYLSFLYEKE